MNKDLALLMTDTHLSESTIEINRSIWKQAVDTCKGKGIKRIFHMGDVFDSRKSQTQELLLVLDELLCMVSEEGLDIIIIPGNHDKTSYESQDSFLHPFRFHPSVTIVSNYWGVGNKTYSEFPDDMIVMFAPFFDEKSGKYAEVLKAHKQACSDKYKHRILLTHIGVNEAVMNGGSIIENHLDSNLFDDFTKVYVGHFHDYQELNKGKIVYIGSTYQSNYGEDNKKGFQILKSDGSLEFIKSKFPEYKKITIDINKTSKEDLIELKKEYEGSEDNIRFVFKGDKEKLAKVDKTEFSALGIDVKTEEFDIKVIDYSSQQVTTFNSETIKEEWNEFTKDNQETQEKGIEYLEKSLK